MNWPNELIIKRDATNTKVINRENIIRFIDKFCDLYILENYLSALQSQNKVNHEELKEIIVVTEERIELIKKYSEAYEKCKTNNESLASFFEDNFHFFRNMIDTYIG